MLSLFTLEVEGHRRNAPLASPLGPVHVGAISHKFEFNIARVGYVGLESLYLRVMKLPTVRIVFELLFLSRESPLKAQVWHNQQSEISRCTQTSSVVIYCSLGRCLANFAANESCSKREDSTGHVDIIHRVVGPQARDKRHFVSRILYKLSSAQIPSCRSYDVQCQCTTLQLVPFQIASKRHVRAVRVQWKYHSMLLVLQQQITTKFHSPLPLARQQQLVDPQHYYPRLWHGP